MSEYMTLFKTIHGSHLYGLSHAASDTDYYEIIQRPNGARKHYAKQTIIDGIDIMQTNLSGFITMANDGTPQALEAMFSPFALGEDHLAAYRNSYRAGLSPMLNTYRRTISNFAAGDPQGSTLRKMTDQMRKGDFKRRRHALRLALNFEQATHSGRFNPTLTPEQAQFATEAANAPETYLATLLGLFPYLDATELLSRGYKSGPKMLPSGFLLHLLDEGAHTQAPSERPQGSEGMLLLTPDPQGSGHLMAPTQSLEALRADLASKPEAPCFFLKREEEEPQA